MLDIISSKISKLNPKVFFLRWRRRLAELVDCVGNDACVVFARRRLPPAAAEIVKIQNNVILKLIVFRMVHNLFYNNL